MTRRSIPTVLPALAAVLLAAAQADAQAQRRAVFVGHDNNLEGAVTSLVFDANDHPQVVQRLVTPTSNVAAISLTPDGRYIAATHADGALEKDITIIQVGPDASLRLVGGFRVVERATALDVLWLTDELLAVPKISNSTLGDHTLDIYRFDPAGPSLTQVHSETGAFTFLIKAAKHPTLPVLYVSDSPLGGQGTIYAYEWDPSGALTLLDILPTTAYGVWIGISHDGRRLYVPGGIGGTGDQIDAVDLAPDGRMSYNFRGPFQSVDRSPKGLVFGKDNDVLFVTHGGDGRALSYTLDPGSGEPAFVHVVHDAQIGFALGHVAILDDILLVTDTSTIYSTPAGIAAFRYDSGGQTTTLGPMVDTGGSGAKSIAAWDAEPVCYPDCDGDGVLDFFDFLCFQNAFLAGDPYADCDGDGVLDFFDFLCFQNAFLAGCP